MVLPLIRSLVRTPKLSDRRTDHGVPSCWSFDSCIATIFTATRWEDLSTPLEQSPISVRFFKSCKFYNYDDEPLIEFIHGLCALI
ncbi:hypothetical protein F511_34962 [Dorcoceras hygrometricum]|uniref:Uncharacterized protein n=1 Tax=Dorcoceras hygrometricum TaxID=472368 RepID=A0A2Z7CMR2_9LAMI|nr:hypothetical protein F511_34962 [Dorcoceras hygrometricum]